MGKEDHWSGKFPYGNSSGLGNVTGTGGCPTAICNWNEHMMYDNLPMCLQELKQTGFFSRGKMYYSVAIRASGRRIPFLRCTVLRDLCMKVMDKPWPVVTHCTRFMCSNSIRVSATDSDIKTVNILGESYLADAMTNVTPKILSKVGLKKHRQEYHPINLIKRRIENYFYTKFTRSSGNPIFAVFDNLNPVVSNYKNFDSLLIPENHPCRVPSDTYYVNSSYVLRTHTSAHQEELIQMGCDAFLCVGDVYRRDAIDSSHYPVFHQMEGVRLFRESEVAL